MGDKYEMWKLQRRIKEYKLGEINIFNYKDIA